MSELQELAGQLEGGDVYGETLDDGCDVVVMLGQRYRQLLEKEQFLEVMTKVLKGFLFDLTDDRFHQKLPDRVAGYHELAVKEFCKHRKEARALLHTMGVLL